MTGINLIAIAIAFAVMARASILLQESSMMPAAMHGALQVVGVLAIIVTTLGLVILSLSRYV